MGRIIGVRQGLLLGLVLVFLAGCSAVRFAYNQAPELAYWRLDSYLDFTDSQEPRVRERIARWFHWNRSTQLPHYVQALGRAQKDAPHNATPAQACAWWNEVETWRDAAYEEILPAFADLALELEAPQLDHLQRRFEKSNREFRKDYLQDDAQDRLEASVDRAVERAEMLYGDLDKSQRLWVEQQVRTSPFDAQRWHAERQRRQQDLLQTLRALKTGPASPEQARAALRTYYQRLIQSPVESYRAYSDQLTAYNCEFAAQLHNRTTAEQRHAAVRKLKGWETDLRALMSPH